MFDISLEKVRQAVVFLIALILSIAVHEFGHAFVADRLGDDTPRRDGRVTLNPFVHADPIGTLVMPLVILFTGWPLIGWGKPVYVNPARFTRRLRMKTSHLLVAAAGPAMNVMLALLVTIIYTVLLAVGAFSPTSPISTGIIGVISLNWALAFFNLIPCPPLDGGAVLAGLLPDRYDNVNQFLRQYGWMILIGLLITGAISYFLIPAYYVTGLFLRLAFAVAG
jgi:Zn-dependent protease